MTTVTHTTRTLKLSPKAGVKLSLTKLSQVLLLCLCLLLLGALNLKAETSVTLRSDTEINAEYVYLSDVFTGVPTHLDQKIASAPEPGRSLVFDGRVLTLLAKRFDLVWMPVTSQPAFKVTRQSYHVNRDTLYAVISNYLRQEKGFDGEARILLDHTTLNLHLDPATSPEVTVTSAMVDPYTQRFSAVLSIATNNVTQRQISLSGRVIEMIEIPVLARRLQSGEVISQDDVAFIKMARSDVASNILLSSDNLVGKTPRRFVAPDKPVRQNDVRLPYLVERGQLVMMTLQTPQMTITVRGVARDNGARGEMVQVMNSKSNQAVDAQVIAPGKVRVLGAPQVASFGTSNRIQ